MYFVSFFHWFHLLLQPSVADSGLSLRCINELFTLIAARTAASAKSSPGDAVRYVVKCNFVQIYQESVFDLLAEAAPQYIAGTTALNARVAQDAGLRIRWSSGKHFYVENLSV
jgi:hypothetical protein